MSESKNQFPPGWDENRVNRVLEHYESQSEAEAVAEDEAMLQAYKAAISDFDNAAGDGLVQTK